MDLRSLNSFIQVAEMNSFTRAAEKLGFSQPTISFQIKQLEKELGAQLFERIGHSVKLTNAGQGVLAYAQKICRMAQEMALQPDTPPEPSGEIRIAMADSLCAPLVVQQFARFRQRFPGIALHVTTAGTDELFRLLDHNEVDLVCTLDHHIYSANYVIVSEEEIGVHIVAPAEHPLAARRDLRLTELADQPFLLTERDMSYGRMLHEQFARFNLEIHPALEISSPQQICTLVMQGAGLSFLPDFITEEAVRSGRLVRLPVQDLQINIWKQLLHHRGKWQSLQLQAAIDYLSGVRLG